MVPPAGTQHVAVIDEVRPHAAWRHNRRRRHSSLAMLSPVEFETGTTRTDGAGLAASRLASTNKMKYKTTSTAQAA